MKNKELVTELAARMGWTAQEVAETLFAYNFNYRTENICTDAVVPAGAWLCEQRYFTHFVAHLNG